MRRVRHTGVVVRDLEAAVAFFTAVGLEERGRASLGGDWVDRVVGLVGVRSDIVAMAAPDGSGEIELARFRTPVEPVEHPPAPANRPGLRHLAYWVDDLDRALTGLGELGYGLVGEVAGYDGGIRVCYVRGPEGLIVELADTAG